MSSPATVPSGTVSTATQCPSMVITENTCYGSELKPAWKLYKNNAMQDLNTVLKNIISQLANVGINLPISVPIKVKNYQDVLLVSFAMYMDVSSRDATLNAQNNKKAMGDAYAASNTQAFYNAIVTDMANKYLGCNKVEVSVIVIAVLLIVAFLVALLYS